MESITFSLADYFSFTLMLALSLAIGVYFGFFSKSKQNSTSDYLLGGKTMATFPIAMSLVASFISGITILAYPSEMYTYGTQFCMLFLAAIAACYVISVTFLPVFYDLQLTSSYEYMEMRFDRRCRIFTSFIFTLGMVLHLPVVIYVPAIAFAQVTDINIHAVTIFLSVVCIFYTSIGGMRAVVWTDTLQILTTVGAMVAVVILGTTAVGGVGEVFKRANDGGRLQFFNMDPSPFQRTSFWSVLFGLGTMWTSQLGVNPMFIQRFMSVPTIQESRKSLWIFCIGFVAFKEVSSYIGLILYAHYQGCDPISAGIVKKADQLLPHYIMEISQFVPGLSGLFIAGVFSAALSTMSASLNTLSGTIYSDFLKPFMPNASEKTASNVMKLTVVVMGSVCVGLVLVVERLGSIMQLVSSLSGVTAGTLLGMFTIGMLVPRANAKGALCGAIASLLFVGWMVFGAQTSAATGHLKHPYLNMSVEKCDLGFNITTPTILNMTDTHTSNDDVFWLYRIGFMYYTLVGAFVVFMVGVPVSLFTEAPGNVNPKLLFQFARRWAPKSSQGDYTSVEQELTNLRKMSAY